MSLRAGGGPTGEATSSAHEVDSVSAGVKEVDDASSAGLVMRSARDVGFAASDILNVIFVKSMQ